jgi:hypothetical protein
MGTPSGLVVGKQLDRLDRHCRAFVALSPFVLVGTCDSSGACDVSPSQAHRRRGAEANGVSGVTRAVLAAVFAGAGAAKLAFRKDRLRAQRCPGWLTSRRARCASSVHPDKLWIPAAAGGSYGLNAESDNPEGGKELLQVMAEPENMNKSASLQGALPSIPNDQFQIPSALEPMMPFMEEGKIVPFMDQLWPNAEVQQAHFTAVQQLFTGEITIDEALRSMDEAYQKGS